MYETLKLNERPSKILEIEDSYTAYCFDEAIAYILARLKAGEKPVFKENHKGSYSKPSDIYKKFSTGGGE